MAKTPQEKDDWKQKAIAERQDVDILKQRVITARQEVDILKQVRQKLISEPTEVSYLETLQFTQQEAIPEIDSGSFEWLDFVKTKVYNDISENLVRMFNRTVNHRSMIFYTISGPMGAGKTRWCHQLSKDLLQIFSTGFLSIYVNMKKIEILKPHLNEGLQLVGQLLA